MLVQFTQIAALPTDVKARLLRHLRAAPLMMDSTPIQFEGFHLSPSDVQFHQHQAKSNQSGPQILMENS